MLIYTIVLPNETIFNQLLIFSVEYNEYGDFGNLPRSAHYTSPRPSLYANSLNSRPTESYRRPPSRLITVSEADLRDIPDHERYSAIDRKLYRK